MTRLLSLPIRLQLSLIALIITLPVIGLILYAGVSQRIHATEDAFLLTRMIADRVVSEQQEVAYDAEHLLKAIAAMPEIQQRNVAQLSTQLRQIQLQHDEYINILVADLTGAVWATAATPGLSANLRERRYFRNAIANGKFSSGEYIISKGLGVPIFNFAYPYRDSSGAIAGAVIVSYSLDIYSKVLRIDTLPKATNFLLLDHQGTILNRARESKEGIGKKYPEGSLQQMFDGPDEFSYRGVTSQGKDGFITWRKIRLQGEDTPYMYVRVAIPAASALAEGNRKLAINLSLIGVCLIAALGVAYRIGKHSIVDRLALLEQATAAVAEGDLNVQVAEAIPGGELGRLALRFEEMARRLEQREQGLRESQAQLHSITNASLSAIIMIDRQGRIVFWNPAAETILGYTADEVADKNLHQLLAPDRFHADHAQAFPLFAGSGTGPAIGKTIELAAIRKDGQEITILLSLSSVQLHGEWHAVGIVQDITRMKHYQQELLEAKQAAEVASQAKSQFLANMSHEIRTPLNGVIGMAQLLRYTELNHEQAEYIRYLELSASNLLALLNDILDLSKIEAGKMSLEQTPFSLTESIDEVAATQKPQIERKQLQLAIKLAPDLPLVLSGDPLRFRQIMLNLLANAVKFTDSGSITISASILSSHGATVTILLTVADTGMGMSAEALERIFAPFEQADNSNTRRFGGCGLGLTICRRLAELMGGQIRAESVPDQGSTFYVELPFNVIDQPVTAVHEQTSISSDTQPTRKLKIPG